jgi:hypothetical protein
MTEIVSFFFDLGRGARLENRPRDAAGVHATARAEWLAGWDWADTRCKWESGK